MNKTYFTLDEKRSFLKNNGFKFCRRVTSTMRKKGKKITSLSNGIFRKVEEVEIYYIDESSGTKRILKEVYRKDSGYCED